MQLLSALFSLGHFLRQALTKSLECEVNECRGLCVRQEDMYYKMSGRPDPLKKNICTEGFFISKSGWREKEKEKKREPFQVDALLWTTHPRDSLRVSVTCGQCKQTCWWIRNRTNGRLHALPCLHMTVLKIAVHSVECLRAVCIDGNCQLNRPEKSFHLSIMAYKNRQGSVMSNQLIAKVAWSVTGGWCKLNYTNLTAVIMGVLPGDVYKNLNQWFH